MKALSRRAKSALRTLAWQSVGFAVVFVLLAIGIYRVETTRVLVEEDRDRSAERICVDFRKVGYRCPRHSDSERVRPSTEFSPSPKSSHPTDLSSSADSPSVPDQSSHHQGTSEGTPGGTKTPPTSQKPPKQAEPQPPTVDTPADTSPVTPPPPAEPEAPEQPGHSGGGASGEHAAQVCVDLAVSACVKTELP